MSDSAKPRLRFAPSPTGHLHIGGARTALYNWLLARQWEGAFILRIEDTDRERSTKEHEASILQSLRWLGLDWDEGPLYQSARTDLYRATVDKLFQTGRAYRCYCTAVALDAKRKEAQAQGRPPRYDRTCRDRTDQPAEPYCIRFKSERAGSTVVEDLIRGRVTFQNEELDDLIIARTDGTPTYNLCVVGDDIDMKITHVVRGDDHLNNTPRQIQLYQALGFKPPQFAHIPLILGPDRSRLSKRHGATSVTAYIEAGYLPEAMVNWLARIGWSHGDQEIFSLDELRRLFSLKEVSQSAGVFNPEKLDWLNGHFIRQSPPEKLAAEVKPFLNRIGINQPDPTRLVRAVAASREKVKHLTELASLIDFFFLPAVRYDENAARKFLTPEGRGRLATLRDRLRSHDDFSHPALETLLKKASESLGCKLGDLAQPLRVALTGRAVAPGIYDILSILGREESVARICQTLDRN